MNKVSYILLLMTALLLHRARLRLFVRTPSGDQSIEVQTVKFIISRNN